MTHLTGQSITKLKINASVPSISIYINRSSLRQDFFYREERKEFVVICYQHSSKKTQEYFSFHLILFRYRKTLGKTEITIMTFLHIGLVLGSWIELPKSGSAKTWSRVCVGKLPQNGNMAQSVGINARLFTFLIETALF